MYINIEWSTLFLSLGSTLIAVSVGWGKIISRLESLEKASELAILEKKELSASIIDLKIEITKLTGEIKELRNTYGHNH